MNVHDLDNQSQHLSISHQARKSQKEILMSLYFQKKKSQFLPCPLKSCHIKKKSTLSYKLGAT